MVTVSLDRRIQVWDLRQREATRTITCAHAGEVSAIGFDSAGRTFASGGADQFVRVWSCATGQLICETDAHATAIAKVCAAGLKKRCVRPLMMSLDMKQICFPPEHTWAVQPIQKAFGVHCWMSRCTELHTKRGSTLGL